MRRSIKYAFKKDDKFLKELNKNEDLNFIVTSLQCKGLASLKKDEVLTMLKEIFTKTSQLNEMYLRLKNAYSITYSKRFKRLYRDLSLQETITEKNAENSSVEFLFTEANFLREMHIYYYINYNEWVGFDCVIADRWRSENAI